MIAGPFWVSRQIAIVLRPQGDDQLDSEMLALRDAGIDVVVSMLEESEAVDLGLGREEEAAGKAGLGFVNYSIPDHGVPINIRQFYKFLRGLRKLLASHKRIGVHCRASIGRASVAVASLLVRSGMPTAEAWFQVEAARGMPVPDTKEQRKWVDRFIRAKD